MKTSGLCQKRADNLPRRQSEVRKFPMFSAESEQTLWRLWRDHHDVSAAHDLVGKYLHLAGEIAEGYDGCGITSEDLIAEGYVGLMRAVCRFDPCRGVRFTAYAIWCVRDAIHEYMVRKMGVSLLQAAMFCGLRGKHGHQQQAGRATLRLVHPQESASNV